MGIYDMIGNNAVREGIGSLVPQWVQKSLSRKVVPDGYSPIKHSLPEDVFLVGYPKSGTTWFQNLVAGIVYGMDPRYLLRDGRDVMVSYFHFIEALERKKLDFLEFIDGGVSSRPCLWHAHVDAWTRNPFGARILVIKYEDLLEDPVPELERFCDFTGIRRAPGFLEDVAEAARFCNLRQKEVTLGVSRPDVWPADKFFFRRGIAGSHRDEMPARVLEKFLQQAGQTLRRHNYSLNETACAATS